MGARNFLRQLQDSLAGSEYLDFASGEVMAFIPAQDLQGGIQIGDGTRDMNLTIFLGSTSNKVVFNATTQAIELTGVSLASGNTALADDETFIFGTDSDVTLSFNTATLTVAGAADDLIISVGNGTNSFDLNWFGNTASDTIAVDASANLVTLNGIDLKLNDDDILAFGDSSDVTVAFNTATLTIGAAADDQVIAVGNGTNSFDLNWFGNTASDSIAIDASANQVTLNGVDFKLNDDDILALGDSSDVTLAFNTATLTIGAAADDQIINVGNGTNSFDVNLFGNIANTAVTWDASVSTLGTTGAVRNNLNVTPSRYRLIWMAGQRGKPGINADIQNASEAVRMIADPDFEILGVNATSASTTFYAEGGINLTTAGADGDEVILLPHLDANQSAWTQVTWGTDRQVQWECDITTPGNVTNCIVWAGLKLTNTEVTATDDNQAFFRYEDDVNGGEWQAISSIGGTDDEHDTNVAVTGGVRFHLKITIDSSRVARFFINGALVETSAALTDTTDLIPYIGVAADGAGGTKALIVHSQAISRRIPG